MSLRETRLTKSDLHAIRRFIDDDGVARFDVGRKRGLSYHAAYDEIVRATGCRTTEDPKGTSQWTREGIRRLGALNEAYWAAARPFIQQKSIDRKVAEFNAKKKAEDESKPAPEAITDAGGAPDMAGEPQRAEGHGARLDPGVPADDRRDDQRPADAGGPQGVARAGS